MKWYLITGVRRCGKSCLMQTIANYLEFEMYPLTFEEYLGMKEGDSLLLSA